MSDSYAVRVGKLRKGGRPLFIAFPAIRLERGPRECSPGDRRDDASNAPDIRDRLARTIYIYQGAYSTKLLDRFKLSNSNPIHLPIPANIVIKLSADIPLTGEYELLQPAEVTVYRQAIRSLLYLLNSTGLDLCYTVG
jgi:hypothetical protein